MIEITKTDLIDMLGQQDPNTTTTQITEDGRKVSKLMESQRLDIPRLITKLEGTMLQSFMINLASVVSCPSGTVPSKYRFDSAGFYFTYDSGTKIDIMNGIKACLLTSK